MSNLAAMLRLPTNLKSTQWQILAGPILILLILSMMAASVVDLPLPVPPMIPTVWPLLTEKLILERLGAPDSA